MHSVIAIKSAGGEVWGSMVKTSVSTEGGTGGNWSVFDVRDTSSSLICWDGEEVSSLAC